MDPVTATSSVSPIPNELLQHPYTIHNLVYTRMVHCDGLMLVGYRGWKYRSDGSRISNLALWNPVLKNLRWVEPPVETITSTDYFGIGYNSDGYKISVRLNDLTKKKKIKESQRGEEHLSKNF
ncbi:unnamed protein product [Brassica rapa]|uniref:F-box associated beta-propeller type 1 domain-containing protein n=1 Tax=Brassica campestris TaxID=3711 RepID=A0A8D9LPV1_BRACM|nr:unnamed protein product [Brassica rapa]